MSQKTDTFTTTNPATGETIDSYTHMSSDTVDSIITDCHKACTEWRRRTLSDRAAVISNLSQALAERSDELATLMVEEMGKLRSQADSEIELCVGICKYTAENGPAQLADEVRTLPNGGRGLITYAPIGVIYGIQPWNFPSYQVFRYAVASLMAGNGVILKHASSVTGSALLLEEIFKAADFPQNLFRVLVISHDQSDEVIEHELVRGVTLTGSPDAGKHVGKLAANSLKKTVLELGSNDAYLVLSDADLETAVKVCVQGRIFNNGETCVAAKRFIVVDSQYENFKKQFVEKMSSLVAGDPNSEHSDLGPMARKELREKLHDQVMESIKKGASVLCGGEIPEGPGAYYPATVLENVTPGQPAYDDELFGPVASLIRAADDTDAMQIANDSRFGLGGGIISSNSAEAENFAKSEFDTGMVFINSFGLAQPNMPFGGVKNSGYGREHGGFGVREFVNVKSIMTLNN